MVPLSSRGQCSASVEHYRHIMSRFKRLLDYPSKFKYRNAPHAALLMYHSVGTARDFGKAMAVSENNFYRQMKFFKTNFRVASLVDDLQSIDRPSVIITFDDGYADNYHTVLPILNDLRMPATFFISTGCVESGEVYWWDQLGSVLRLLSPHTSGLASLFDLFRFYGIDYEAKEIGSEKTYYKIAKYCKEMDRHSRDDFLRKLQEISGDSDKCVYRECRPMTKSEVAELSKNDLVSIGAHTVNHVCLPALDYRGQSEEMLQSKLTLESWIGKKVTLFAFPYGDYNQDSIKLCKELGFKKAVTTSPGRVFSGGNDVYTLPRIPVTDNSFLWLENRLGRLLARNGL